MNFFRPSTIVTVALVFCACAMMSEAIMDWRSAPGVQNLLQNNRIARRMTQGPIGNIIDTIIGIILTLLDTIFGGVGGIEQLKTMGDDVEQLKTVMGVA